jgi:hypothetical protein
VLPTGMADPTPKVALLWWKSASWASPTLDIIRHAKRTDLVRFIGLVYGVQPVLQIPAARYFGPASGGIRANQAEPAIARSVPPYRLFGLKTTTLLVWSHPLHMDRLLLLHSPTRDGHPTSSIVVPALPSSRLTTASKPFLLYENQECSFFSQF